MVCPYMEKVDRKWSTMSKEKTRIKVKRIFSEDFKKAIVKDYENGQFSVQELSDLHNIAFSAIYRWIYRYSVYPKLNIKVVEMSESSTKKVKDLQKRVAELERIVGQKQLNIDFLEKMIELAKEELGIDIKKNFDTPHSDGSKLNKEGSR
jgi:transposase